MSTSDIIHISLVLFGLIGTVVSSLVVFAVGNARKHGEHRVRLAKLETTGSITANIQKDIQNLRESLIAHGVSINK